MAKIELTPEELEFLTECINEQKDVPPELLTKLSPGFFEKLAAEGRFDFKALDKFKIPTIEYAGKRPESVILAQAAITGGAAPLQVVRSFANGKNGDWKNLIVQGDNLQFLKTCYLNQDPVVSDKIKGKVKLIYIDPPFGTGDEYGGGGAMSYSAKLMWAEYIETLRERLIFLREILHLQGNIFVRIDYRFGYYVKIVMDEVFGKDNFKNHLVINKTSRPTEEINQYHSSHDFIFFYSKSKDSYFKNYEVKRDEPKWRAMHLPGSRWSPIPEKYVHLFSKKNLKEKNGQYSSRARIILGKELLPPGTRHWALSQETVYKLEGEGKIRLNSKGNPESIESDMKKIDDNWTDIPGYAKTTGYPTENAEELLERIILSGTEVNDMVMDVFGGSGTTAAVAEKLGRRWVVCDFGKHAIYTMQKRILNIAESKKLGNGEKTKEYGQSPKPFCVVSAGAYDFTRIMDLRKNQDAYITFVLGLFNIVREKADFSKKYKLPNIYAEKNGDPVEVFPVWDDEYLKNIRIDEEYLQGIIDASGGKLKGDYYIITPETCARLGDTTLKNAGKEKVNFKLLKFPYKVLEEVSRHFQIEEQAASSMDINRLISSVGFYFNEEVKVEAEKKNGGVKITKFTTGILDKSGQRFKGLDGLAMMLVDFDYDGKVFDMDTAVYSKDIGEDGVVKVEALTKDSHIIAIDKHGNESKVVKIK